MSHLKSRLRSLFHHQPKRVAASAEVRRLINERALCSTLHSYRRVAHKSLVASSSSDECTYQIDTFIRSIPGSASSLRFLPASFGDDDGRRVCPVFFYYPRQYFTVASAPIFCAPFFFHPHGCLIWLSIRLPLGLLPSLRRASCRHNNAKRCARPAQFRTAASLWQCSTRRGRCPTVLA